MIRKMVDIDQDKCNGCGLCVNACHEGAIQLIDGKAQLVRDDYCDGLGNCLPACPTGAISIVEREAVPFDEQAVKAHMEAKHQPHQGCPGSMARNLNSAPRAEAPAAAPGQQPSELRQWPVQIQLVPVNAACFKGAQLLIAADCAAYAHAGFHSDFMRGKVTLIGCPKLDDVDYSEKLTEILRQNDIASLTIVRMEVPCCGGLTHAATTALHNCGKLIPWRVITLGLNGEILEDR